MQVSSRFLLVWLIVDSFPYLGFSPFYSSMLVAWSVTEVIRYSFFALSLSGWQPRALTWLRYNTFFVLYPIGITSECALVWLATKPAGDVNPWFKTLLHAVLAIYVPGKCAYAKERSSTNDKTGSYVLYTYMMKQRKKVMRGLKAQDKKAT